MVFSEVTYVSTQYLRECACSCLCVCEIEREKREEREREGGREGEREIKRVIAPSPPM